jgi:hypothetical protein
LLKEIAGKKGLLTSSSSSSSAVAEDKKEGEGVAATSEEEKEKLRSVFTNLAENMEKQLSLLHSQDGTGIVAGETSDDISGAGERAVVGPSVTISNELIAKAFDLSYGTTPAATVAPNAAEKTQSFTQEDEGEREAVKTEDGVFSEEGGSEGKESNTSEQGTAKEGATGDEGSAASGAAVAPSTNYENQPLPEEWNLSFDEEIDPLIVAISPYSSQLTYRMSAVTLLKKQIRAALGCVSYEIGLFPINCFLPVDPIRLSVIISQGQVAFWQTGVVERLKTIVDNPSELNRFIMEQQQQQESGMEGNGACFLYF